MATLSGSLETFAPSEVLHLVASTGKTGMLRIEGPGVSGKIYAVDGSLTYATTRSDDSPIEHLFEFGVLSDEPPTDRRSVEVERMSDSDRMAELLRQQLIDVLVRVMRLESGTFSFDDGATTAEEIPHAFEVDDILAAAEDRVQEWDEIGEVLPSTSTLVHLSPRLAEDVDQVTLDARSWAVIAVIGAGSTAAGMAHDLRVFEFAAAKKVADLIRLGLVQVADEERVELAGATPVEGDNEAEGVDIEWSEPPSEGPDAKEPAREKLQEEESEADASEADEPSEEKPPDEEEPPGELARRWRELSRQRADV